MRMVTEPTDLLITQGQKLRALLLGRRRSRFSI
jgi:hypothetical protein